VDDKKPKISKKAIIAIAIVVLLLAAGGAYAYFEIQERDAALGRLAQATELLASADSIVIDADAVVRGDITPELGAKASQAATALPTAVADLQEAIELLQRIQDDLPSEQAQEAVALIASAEGRLAMLEHAPTLLQANIVAAASLEPARAAWEHVSAAEGLKDQATTEYNRLTRASVTRSQQLNTQAEERFRQAKEQFRLADSAFPEAELDRFITYIEANLEMLAISKRADAAFLAGRIAEANTLAGQVNTKDAQIVEQLKALPETPEAAIAGAYEKLAGPATELYFEARDRVTKADAELERLAQ